jgi:hypothetical protein
VIYLPIIRQYDSALGDPVSPASIFLGAAVRKTHRQNEVPAMSFLHDGFDVGELRAVGGDGEAGGTDHTVDFFLGFELYGGEDEHGEEECHEC